MAELFHLVISVSCMLILVCFRGVTSSVRQNVQTLHSQLLQTYNKDIGPNADQTQPITLYISFNMFTLQEFDDKTGKLTILGYATIEWNDDRIVWNPILHGYTTTVAIPQSKVWIPNIFIVRPYSTVKTLGNDFITVTYAADGTAYWIVPDLFEVVCTANVAYYPFDRQHCEILLVPWGYTSKTFDLQLRSDTMSNVQFMENGIWKVLSTELSVLRDDQLQGQYVVMAIEFQRRPLFIMMNIILPIVVIGILNVFVFLLPPDPGERSAFGVTVLLAMAVFLSIVSDKLPSTSEPHIPRISIYLLVQLILSAVIMVVAIFGLKLYNKQEDEPVPKWTTSLVRMCSIRGKQRKEIRYRDNTENTTNLRKKQVQDNQGNDQYASGGMETIRGRYNVHGTYRGHTNGERSISYSDSREFTNGHRNYRHLPEVGSQQQYYRRDPLTSRRTFKSKVHDKVPKEVERPMLTWIDVAKWFDNVCFVFFILLTLCLFIVNIVDSTFYLRTKV